VESQYNMREVQRRIMELKPYFMQMGVSGDYITVDAIFKPKWVLLDTDDVKYTPNKDNKSVKFYAMANTTEIDEIFDLVEAIIKHNKDREEKFQLLKMKAEELKLLFTDNNLAALKRLKFVFDDITIDVENEINFDVLPEREVEDDVSDITNESVNMVPREIPEDMLNNDEEV